MVKAAPLALCAVLALGLLAASAAPKLSKWQQLQAEHFKNSAPADEYFGRQKLSYLGMNNTFRDSAISSGEHTTDGSIVNKVALAEDALSAWATKYPRDPQLPRTYFLAFQVERKIWIKANQDRAWVVLNRLVHDFPDSYFGKVVKRDLTIGFTEHYYALPLPCATPPPAPQTTASPDTTAPEAGDASPSPSPSPTPAATATPSPGPLETTVAKGLRVQILPQPCIPPPTPSPSPSPSPTPSATPTASAAPDSAPMPEASAQPT